MSLATEASSALDRQYGAGAPSVRPHADPHLIDPITFEVLRHKIDEIVAEAYYTIGRVSGSPLVYEAGDHQEAICTPAGDLAAFGAGALTWVNSIGAGVRHIVKEYADNPGFEEDDQFILNDPYVAASHASDVQVLAPVFWQGKIIAWAGSASHQLDIGGLSPGSLCLSATEVYQEGFITPGLKLVEKGVVRRDVEATFENMIRMSEVGLLDIRAKIASNHIIKTRLIELADRYGGDTVEALFGQLIAYSDERLRSRLLSIPDGTWRSSNWVENFVETENLNVSVAVTKVADRLTFDFTGTSSQATHALNIGPVGAMGTAFSAVVAMLGAEIPWNEGLFKRVDFVLPEGSLVNPKRPASHSANVPTGASVLIITTCQNALSRMLMQSESMMQEACGNSASSQNTLVISGENREGAFFTNLMLEGAAGGGGGFRDHDGVSTGSTSTWEVKTMIANVESNEMLYPLLYLWRAETTDSGGAGEFRGGMGLSAGLLPWRTAAPITMFNIGSGSRVRLCLGLDGGYPASHTPLRILRDADLDAVLRIRSLKALDGAGSGVIERVPAKAQAILQSTDIVYGFLSAGGGGYGDPLDRDPEKAAIDVREGCVSRPSARECYGVVLTDGLQLDEAGTAAEREAVRHQRLAACQPYDGAEAEFSRSCSTCGAVTSGLDAQVSSYETRSSRFEPLEVAPADDSFVLRHIICRRCGTLLQVSPAPASAQHG